MPLGRVTRMESLKEWHDFFVVLGAASGSLIGAMFVVVSIGSGIVTEDRALEGRIFLTPTIVHLALVLAVCTFVLVPSLTPAAFAWALGVVGFLFLGYAGRNVFHIGRRSPVEHVDRLWYGVVPALAYLILIGSVVLMLLPRPGAMEMLAVALALLVVASIRNAWDLILYFVQKQSTR
jgi:hypothetical protein